MKIVFAPGSFEDFDGTQEELDQLIKSIEEMAVNGTLMEESQPVDLDMLEIENPDLYEKIMNFAGQEYDEDSVDEYKNSLN